MRMRWRTRRLIARAKSPAVRGRRNPRLWRQTASAPAPRGAAASSVGISVRARYQNGAFRPIVPVELPEGAEVEIVIRRDERSSIALAVSGKFPNKS